VFPTFLANTARRVRRVRTVLEVIATNSCPGRRLAEPPIHKENVVMAALAVPVSKCAGVPWLLNVAAPHRCLCRHQIVRTDGTGGRRTLQRNCHAEDECGH
jgi:hypothetical protein